MTDENSMGVRYDRVGAVQVLDEKGWIQGGWEGEGGVCLHQAIRLCSPQPGDACLVSEVYKRRGRGPEWNDEGGRTYHEVLHEIKESPDITDAELADTFGPNWQSVVMLVRRAAVLTEDEVARLGTAGAAAWAAAGDAVWAAARDAVWDAAGAAAGAAARDAARDAAGAAAGAAARDAARAVVVRDLIGQHGFTQEHYDTLTGPWREVIGDI